MRNLLATAAAATLLFALCATPVAAGDVVQLTSETFDSSVGEGGWLLEFYAPWCGFCKRLAPTYEQVATALKSDGISVAKIDATQDRALAARFPVSGYPTLFYVQDGEVYKFSGSRSKDGLIHFAKKGWQTAEKLTSWSSPFGFAGKAKGLLVYSGLLVVKAYQMMVDDYNLQPLIAVAILSIAGVLATFGVAFAASYLCVSSSPRHVKRD